MAANSFRQKCHFPSLLFLLGCLAPPLQAESHLRLPDWRALTLSLPPALVVKAEVTATVAQEAAGGLVQRSGTSTPAPGELLYHLIVETRLKWFLASKTWIGELWLRPDLTALQRSRLKSGKQRNHKIYRYAGSGVYRIRRKPRQADDPPSSWPISDERFYPYPPAVNPPCPRISDPYALLLLLSQPAAGKGEALCVFNKNSLYRITLKGDGTETTEVEYQRGSDVVRGQVDAERIHILPRPLGTASEFPVEPFEFLGMEGTVTVLRDPTTRLPVLFEGNVPGFGRAKLRLTQIRPR